MAKKGFGKAVALAVVAGAAAAGISYFRKYQLFNKELDEEFHDFEDEEPDGPVPDNTMNRKYVSLNANKDELIVAAGDMLHAAKDVAGAAKNVMKDAAAIVADTTREAMNAAADKITFSDDSDDFEDDFEDAVEDAVEDAAEKAAEVVTHVAKAVAEAGNEAVKKACCTNASAEEKTAQEADLSEKEEISSPDQSIEIAVDTEAAVNEDNQKEP